MKDFRSVINDYLKKNDRHKKQLAAVISLSMLVSFSVPMILTEPASSMTGDSFSPVGDILSTQLFNAQGNMLTNYNSSSDNNGYSPAQRSEVALLVGDGIDWAENCTSANAVVEAAKNKYFLGIAYDFSLFLEGNATLKDADAEGRVAVGGNLEFTGGYCYQVGSGNFGYMTALKDTDDYTGIENFAHAIVGGYMKNIHPLSTGNNKTRKNDKVETLEGGHQGYGETLYFPNSEDKFKRFVVGNVDDSNSTHMYCSGGEKYNPNGSHDDVSVNELAEMYQQPDGGIINFTDVFVWLKERSEQLSKKDATGETNINGNVITFTIPKGQENSDTVYFSLPDGIDNEHLEEIRFVNVPYETTQMVIRETETDKLQIIEKRVPKCNLVINCGGTSFNIRGTDNTAKTIITYTDDVVEEISNNRDSSKRDDYNDDDYHNNSNPEVMGWRSNNHPASSKILYNFYEASDTEISYINGNFNGTIFAPNANVKSDDGCSGHLSGALIAKSFTGGLEFGYRPYRGTVDILGSSSGYGVPIRKITPDNKALPGATFGIFKVGEDGNVITPSVADFTSDEDGNGYVNIPTDVQLDGSEEYDTTKDTILNSTYIIKETKAPDGFILDDATQWKIDVKETVTGAGIKEINGTYIPTEIKTEVTIYNKDNAVTDTFKIDAKDSYSVEGRHESRYLTVTRNNDATEYFIMNISDGEVTKVFKTDGSAPATQPIDVTSVSSYMSTSTSYTTVTTLDENNQPVTETRTEVVYPTTTTTKATTPTQENNQGVDVGWFYFKAKAESVPFSMTIYYANGDDAKTIEGTIVGSGNEVSNYNNSELANALSNKKIAAIKVEILSDNGVDDLNSYGSGGFNTEIPTPIDNKTIIWGTIPENASDDSNNSENPENTESSDDTTTETTTSIKVESWYATVTSVVNIDIPATTYVDATSYIDVYSTETIAGLENKSDGYKKSETFTTVAPTEANPKPEDKYQFDPTNKMIMPLPNSAPTFTNNYGLIFNKFSRTGEADAPLKGATIDIEEVTFNGDEPNGTLVNGMRNILDGSASTTIDISKLSDNKLYRFVESATPDDTYETADPIYFVKIDNVIYCTTDAAKAKTYSSGTPNGWESVDIKAHTADSKPSVNMYDIKISGAKIKLAKYNESFSKKLDGAQFQLYAANDDLIYPLGEDETFTITNGEIDLYEMLRNAGSDKYNTAYVQNGYLKPGSYYLFETTPPEDGYDAGTFGFKVNRDYSIEAVEAGTPSFEPLDIQWENSNGQAFIKTANGTLNGNATIENVVSFEVKLADSAQANIYLNTDTGLSKSFTDGVVTGTFSTPTNVNKFEIQYSSWKQGGWDIEYAIINTSDGKSYKYGSESSGSSKSYTINKFVWNDKNHNSRPTIDALILCYKDGKSLWYDGEDITINEGDGDWNEWTVPNVITSNVVGARLVLSGEGSGKFFIQKVGQGDTGWDEVLTNDKCIVTSGTYDNGNVTAGTYNFGDVSALANCVKVKSGSIDIPSDKITQTNGSSEWWWREFKVDTTNIGIPEGSSISKYVIVSPNAANIGYNNADNNGDWKQEWINANTNYEANIVNGTFKLTSQVEKDNLQIKVYYSSETPVTIENIPEPEPEPETPELAAGLAVRVEEDGTIKIPNKKSGDTITITVEKSWKDDAGFEGLRNDSIQVQLKRRTPDGEEDTDFNNSEDYTATLNSGSKWKASWSNLDRHNGNEEQPYKYYVEEVTVNSNYTNTISHDGTTKDGKENVLTSGGTIKVTNSLKTKDISVEKKWYDSDDNTIANNSSLLPESIQVKLQYKKSTDNEEAWADAKKEVTIDEETKKLQTYVITLTKADSWTADITKLPDCYEYRLVELNVPNGWTSDNSDTANGTDKIITLTNTQQVGSLEIEKLWENDTDSDRKAVTVELYRTTESPASTAIKNIPTDADSYENYAKALQYSLYFFDAQMCGSEVGETSAYSWRDDCHADSTVDGGFHDAGDHTMFGLPQGFTASTLGWSYYEFKDAYDSLGQTTHYQVIMKEFCDFFADCIKTEGGTTKVLVQKGNPGVDQKMWDKPEGKTVAEYGGEDWATSGSANIAAEYAASLASYVVCFPNDSNNARYLEKAEQLYNYAKNNLGNPHDYNGDADNNDKDDMAWAAAWLYLATGNSDYKDNCSSYLNNMSVGQYGYYYGDVAAGAMLLYGTYINESYDLSEVTDYLKNNCDNNNTQFKVIANKAWGSIRHNALVQTVALIATKNIENVDYTPWCKSQMNYILGNNTVSGTGVCFITGFNEKSTKNLHHRAATGTLLAKDANDWGNGSKWAQWDGKYSSLNALGGTPHTIVGALSGGRGNNDGYKDDGKDPEGNEVALDYQAGLVGAAAGLYQLTGKGTLATEQELKDASGDELDFVYPSIPVNVTNYDSLELSINRTEPVVLNIGDIKELVLKDTANNEIKNVTWTVNNNLISVNDGVMTADRNGAATLTATVDEHSYDFDVNIQLTSINKQDYITKIKEDMSHVTDITLTKDNDWTHTESKLPLYDENGNVYYYYIVEKDVTGYCTVAYSGNGVKLANGTTQEMSVTNKKPDNTGVTMPSAGGTGTRNYYLAGFGIIGIAGAFWLIRRRKIAE